GKLGQHVQSGAARQHQVEHDTVKALRKDEPEAFLAVGGCDDLVTLRAQPALQATEDFALVFDDQDAGHTTPPLAGHSEGRLSGTQLDTRLNWVKDAATGQPAHGGREPETVARG